MLSSRCSRNPVYRALFLVVGGMLSLTGLLPGLSKPASGSEVHRVVGPEEPDRSLFSAESARGIVVTHDNDFFAQDTDRDYTGGIQFSFPGVRNAPRLQFGRTRVGTETFTSQPVLVFDCRRTVHSCKAKAWERSDRIGVRFK